MSHTFQRLPINGEYFISFLNSSFLTGQSIGKYFVNLLKSPVTTHTREEEKRTVNSLHNFHFSFFGRNKLLLSHFRMED